LIVALIFLVPSLGCNGDDGEIGEIIAVQIFSPDDFYVPPSEEPPPPAIPQQEDEELPDIPLNNPTTVEEEFPIETEPLPDEPETESAEPVETKTDVDKTPVRTPDVTSPKDTDGEGASDGTLEIHSPATAGGSPFAGATVDNRNFTYSYWFTQAFNKIGRNWQRPRIITDGPIVCTIYFQVIKSGRVIEVEITKSSGIPEFDESLKQAIERSAPFPPLPRKFTDEIIGITLPVKQDPSRL